MREQPTHSHVYFFWRLSMWSLWMCSTSLSMLPMSPVRHPSHAQTVICSWKSSSSWRAFTGELGTSPSVSDETSDMPSSRSGGASWSCAAAEGVLDRPAVLRRFAGGPSSSTSVASSGYSSSDDDIDEREDSSIGESVLAMVEE